MPRRNSEQSDFAAALLQRSAAIPETIHAKTSAAVERRFAVYRNNVTAGLVNALAARFPVVQQLVGEEFFRAMALAYAAAQPPRSPVLLHYGETFSTFIERFAPVASLPFLADVARLEFARGCAYHAADAYPLATGAFARLPAAALAELRVRLHPSVSLLWSAFPVLSIWEAHHGSGVRLDEISWEPESILIARPDLIVQMRRVPDVAFTFLGAVRVGRTLSEALDGAAMEASGMSAAELLALLIEARVVIGFAGGQTS